MSKTIQIITSNKEIYNKFSMLNFVDEVVLVNVTASQVSKIINRINKNMEVLVKEKVGDYYIIKKKRPVSIATYMSTSKSKML